MTKGLWFRQSETKTSPNRQYTQTTFKLQLPHHSRLTISVQPIRGLVRDSRFNEKNTGNVQGKHGD